MFMFLAQDLLHQKVTPNIYVFNSLMNVNAHDLYYTLHIHKDMQVNVQIHYWWHVTSSSILYITEVYEASLVSEYECQSGYDYL